MTQATAAAEMSHNYTKTIEMLVVLSWNFSNCDENENERDWEK